MSLMIGGNGSVPGEVAEKLRQRSNGQFYDNFQVIKRQDCRRNLMAVIQQPTKGSSAECTGNCYVE